MSGLDDDGFVLYLNLIKTICGCFGIVFDFNKNKMEEI